MPDSNTTVRTVCFACDIPRDLADALNRESGRIYTQVMVEQYRIFRKKGVWLLPSTQQRYNDFLNKDTPKLLTAHSIDAAQQGFQRACKAAKAYRDGGAHYPYKRKRYRSTVWKNTGIRLKDGALRLSMAQGQDPLSIPLPERLKALPAEAFIELRLVYNKSSRHYEWHLVIDDGIEIQPTTETGVAAIDLGEIHPAAITDGVEACVISCRELRSVSQHTHKRLSKFQQAQSRHKKGSRRWWKLQRRKNRFLAKQERRRRDLEHKVSREVVDWAVEHKVGTLAIGNVRDIASRKRFNAKGQQKISSWSHGRMRDYIGYKAEALGITVNDKVDEAHTSQTCVNCRNQHKPKGRIYTCPACGSVAHRDVQGAANILSRFLYDELGRIHAPPPTYRHPVLRGKRSPG